MSSKKAAENFKRRTWDEAEYARLAVEREDAERSAKRVQLGASADSSLTLDSNFATLKYADPQAQGPSGSQKAYLDVSSRQLDLDAKVGKKEKVEGSRQAGFHCPACDLYFQDSSSLLDHVNGREHLARLGFSQVTKRATVTDVKSRLAQHAASKAASSTAASASAASAASKPAQSYAERVKALQEEEEKEDKKQQQQKKKKKKAKRKNEEEEEETDESLLPLGFASFG